jgi:hypothetical protein
LIGCGIYYDRDKGKRQSCFYPETIFNIEAIEKEDFLEVVENSINYGQGPVEVSRIYLGDILEMVEESWINWNSYKAISNISYRTSPRIKQLKNRIQKLEQQ